LVECPEGCGRKFNPKAIDKHIKICQKGEKKRKVFKVKVVDEEAEKLKKEEPVQEKKKEKVPKWKKESEAFRSRLGNKEVAEPVDDRIECPSCGRKFNEDAAERHISKCVQRTSMANFKKK
jgi:DNA repair exonuclease SbcCD ATPase subunit